MDEIDHALVSLRNQQCKCEHTLFKCPKCGIYKDNLKDEQALKIKYLTNKITEYEAILTSLCFSFVSYNQDGKYDKIGWKATTEQIVITEHSDHDAMQ